MRIWWIWLLLASMAWAIPYDQVSNPRAKGVWVADMAGLLSASQKQSLNRQISQLEAANGTELAVVLVADCSGRNPRDYAHRLLNFWGVGKRGVNNGLLYLVSVQEHRMEVATGDGIRHFASDADLKQLLEQRVVPQFKAKKPDRGVIVCVEELCKRLTPCHFDQLPPLSRVVQSLPDPRKNGSLIADPHKRLPPAAAHKARQQLIDLIHQRDIQIVCVILDDLGGETLGKVEEELKIAWGIRGRDGFLLISRQPPQAYLYLGEDALLDYSLAHRNQFTREANRLVGSGHYAGLIDALHNYLTHPDPRTAPVVDAPASTLSWWDELKPYFPFLGLCTPLVAGFLLARHLRYRARKCPQCAGPMVRLDEQEDDAYLNPQEQVEERLGSVDYDIWLCPGCEITHKGRYAAWFSSYSSCPACSARTLRKSSHTISSPTEWSEGQGRTDSHCLACKFHDVSYYSIARVSPPDTSSDSSSSWSSDSGSSGGGSFGGGSSGDGGAGASW